MAGCRSEATGEASIYFRRICHINPSWKEVSFRGEIWQASLLDQGPQMNVQAIKLNGRRRYFLMDVSMACWKLLGHSKSKAFYAARCDFISFLIQNG